MSDSQFQRNAHKNPILIAIAAVALVLSLIAIFASNSRQASVLSPDTPEGVVQLYLRAVVDGKFETAIGLLSESSQCTVADLDRAYIPSSLRVNLADSEVDGDSAIVKISVELGGGKIFDDGYSESHSYRLKNESGAWKILGIAWPIWECPGVNK
jgi:hypothetical protein